MLGIESWSPVQGKHLPCCTNCLVLHFILILYIVASLCIYLLCLFYLFFHSAVMVFQVQELAGDESLCLCVQNPCMLWPFELESTFSPRIWQLILLSCRGILPWGSIVPISSFLSSFTGHNALLIFSLQWAVFCIIFLALYILFLPLGFPVILSSSRGHNKCFESVYLYVIVPYCTGQVLEGACFGRRGSQELP